MSDLNQDALELHILHRGKISVQPKDKLTPATLARYYTPGVGAVSKHLEAHPEQTRDYSLKHNTVAVISDGSAVLGLGNIGPQGAIPVLEGKAMLFSALAQVDGFPIALDTQDTEEIIRTVRAIAPVFGGINLEDIAAPRCFEIEARLQEELDIPVMHDDQHATAIVALAGLINALKVAGKALSSVKVVVVGAGAAGSAVAKLLVEAGTREVIVTDSKGILSKHRTDLDLYKFQLAELTNPNNVEGTVETAADGADAIIGVAMAGSITAEAVRSMAARSIVFALSNPSPEIEPEAARTAGAFIVATGRSDYPNQINNVLVFPGFFRGALDHNVKKITNVMKLAAAAALAGLVEKPAADHIIPSVFDERVVPTIAAVIKE